jgi:rhomboid protease GluP
VTAQPVYNAAPIHNFRRDLFTATPRVFVTQTLVVINLAIFGAMALTAGGFFSPSVQTMIRWGAGFGPLTTNGQPWRLFTEMFLHFGIIHVGMNMFVLWQGGPLVERLFGNFAFFVIYIFSGLVGSFVSLYAHPMSVAAGASGAVFGVYGALLGFLVVQRGTVPPALLQSLFKAAGMFVVYNIIFGVAASGIDMFAHGGGLIGGFLLGMLLSRKLQRNANLVRTIVTAILGTVIVLYLFTHLRPIQPPNQSDDSFLPAIPRATAA